MFGLKRREDRNSRIVEGRKEVIERMISIAQDGYDSLSDKELIELNTEIIRDFPEIIAPLYSGYKGDFSNDVFDGKLYERYRNTMKVLDGTLNTVLYQTQHDQFRIGLEKILDEEKFEDIVIFHAGFGWDIKLKQRPQHLAEAMADKNTLYIYKTSNNQDDVYAVRKLKSNLYLMNLDMALLSDTLFDVIESKGIKNKFVHVYATCLYDVNYKTIKKYIDRNFKILYDFVDEISEKISGIPVTKSILDTHRKILSDHENVIVISTAMELKKSVDKIRGNKIGSILAQNGVNLSDFLNNTNNEPAPKIKKILDRGHKIIGYYGALASWFDYKKIEALAKAKNDYEIVLIGVDYDKSLRKSGILKNKNIHYLGVVDYKDLISRYANYFDVCMIPFIKNEITDSTSPVKLFEYMALGKPIVTTDINECKKYKSSLVSKSDEEFINNIDRALELIKYDSYKRTLKQEASMNTWQNRADIIKNEMKKYYIK